MQTTTQSNQTKQQQARERCAFPSLHSASVLGFAAFTMEPKQEALTEKENIMKFGKVIAKQMPELHKSKVCPVCGKKIKPDYMSAKPGFAWPHVAFGWHCVHCGCTGAESWTVKKDKFVDHPSVTDTKGNDVEASPTWRPSAK